MKRHNEESQLRTLALTNWMKQSKVKWEAEYRFNPDRRWRFDWACPVLKIAIECEGGVWVRGRHSRGAGMIADMDKYNWAALNGWMVLRYTPQNLTQAIEDLEGLRK